MAHGNGHVLAHLIATLDHPDNDIFVHIDKKADKSLLIQHITPHSSRLFILNKSIDVHWGGYSLIEVEMLLFRTAMEYGRYDYFHLMSGQDLPIKSISKINAFFEANKGKEFISFFKQCYDEFTDRVTYRHFLQDSNILNSVLAR